LQKLILPESPPLVNNSFRQKCPFSFDLSFNSSNLDRTSLSQNRNIRSPGSQCKTCKRFFKGRRGLNIHLGRNPNCKRNAQHQISRNFSGSDTLTVPQEVYSVVNGPSTSIESLENMCGDGSNTKIIKHNSKHGCKLCFQLSTKDHFVSSSTHRIFGAVIPQDLHSLNCNSTNLVYLITCRKCKLQYVGETAQKLRERIGQHNSCINHPEKSNNCRILSDHFSKGLCKNATYTVHIIEKLHGSGRDKDGEVDKGITAVRKKIETNWMLKLRTVFPYGLNDRIGDEYMTEKDCSNINSKFPTLKRMKNRHRVRSKSFASSAFIQKHFIYIVNESLRTNLRNSMNLIRVLLSSLKKSSCKFLSNSITEYLSEKHDSFLFYQFFLAALDILSSKLGFHHLQHRLNKKSPSNRCHILFNNKAIDFINVQKIFHDKDVSSLLPHDLKNNTPVVVYKLTETIHAKLFNYKKFVQSIDIDSFLIDDSILPCECQNSPFQDQDHNHIITGNLEIIENHKLRNLISKGPKYREPVKFSIKAAKEEILKGLDDCIYAWSKREGIPLATFNDWKEMIRQKIDDRVAALVHRNARYTRSAFKDTTVKKCLSDLHDKYVMVPIDKAANNVAFICKRYYASIILQELGLLGSVTSTYTEIGNETPDSIINRHKMELKDQFNINVNGKMLNLPTIYWTPKLHKNPVKFRFIIASKQCTVKKLSKNISSIFKLFSDQIDSYNKKTHYFSGIKSYWVIQNRDPVLEVVKKSIARKSAKSVSSFDFSTLYTKIPHDKLVTVLCKIIDFVFKGGIRKKIAVNRYGTAYWVGNNRLSPSMFTKESIINAVSYLIGNCYFRFGDRLFRQDIGIPMGSDPAPFFANLFLYHFESSWLKSIKASNNTLARKFGNVFRYIDDLLALNDSQSFETYYHDIYPEELQLSKENLDCTEANFLDLHIKIEDGIFTTALFDKRDNFGFDITRLPYRNSNIPCRIFYSSITAECLRICRATSSEIHAIRSIRLLLLRMSNQGSDKSKMMTCITRGLNRHQIALKYDVTVNSFVKKLFD